MTPERSDAVSGARLDHTGLVVPNLEQAVAFFQDVFGARIVFRMDRFDDTTGVAPGRLGARRGTGFAIAMLGWGERRLELLQWWPGVSGGQPEPEAVGSAHIAIGVPDVAAALRTLAGVPGVRILGEPVTFAEGPTPGLTNAFVSSPWGCLLELMQWPVD